MAPPTDFLRHACAAAQERVERARAARPDGALRDAALRRPAPPSFAAALGGAGIAVIAEIKRASPSRGPLAEIVDPATLARAYAAGGAAAISVLTEPQWFAGSLDDLTAVTAAVDVPALRKDFVVDGYQLLEARLAGASAALLIVAALDDALLRDLLVAADDAGVDTLVEIHDENEGRRAVAAARAAATGRPLVVGVNARDLTTLTVDSSRFAWLAGLLHHAAPDAIVVAESGVGGPDDVARLRSEGADAVLVGEHVATAGDPTAAVAALVAAGASTTIGTHQ